MNLSLRHCLTNGFLALIVGFFLASPWEGLALDTNSPTDLGGRPLDLRLSPNGRFVLVKTSQRLVTLAADSLQVVDSQPYPDGQYGSPHGLAISPDGRHAYVTGGRDQLFSVLLATNGMFQFGSPIDLSLTNHSPACPLGVALTPDGKKALVARSRANDLVLIDLAAGRILDSIPTPVCPWDVLLSPDGFWVMVSNYGGQRSLPNEPVEYSAGMPVMVDDGHQPLMGSLSFFLLRKQQQELAGFRQIRTGRHPGAMALTQQGMRLLVANAGDDSISVVDTVRQTTVETLHLFSTNRVPAMAMPDGLAVSTNGQELYVACAGLDAVVHFHLANHQDKPQLIPAGRYPGAIAVAGNDLLVANVNGGVQRFSPAISETEAQARHAQAFAAAHLEVLLPPPPPVFSTAPIPVPARLGEPTLVRHVVWVVEPVRPASAPLPKFNQPFARLANYQSTGASTLECEANTWQGAVTPYVQKDPAGSRGDYRLGADVLAQGICGFLWDQAEAFHVTFRNYGVFRTANGSGFLPAASSWLRTNSCPDFPGPDSAIPDHIRAEAFLRELARNQPTGEFSRLVTLQLAATNPADADAAVSSLITGLNQSTFGQDTLVIVTGMGPIGADQSAGAWVIGPWVRPGAVSTRPYDAVSVLHTIGQILGMPPLNRMVAAAPLIDDVFASSDQAK